MGWLGWTAEQALATDVNLVIMALDSRTDLISLIYGDGKPRSTKKKKKPTAADFKAWKEQHNRGMGQLNG
jgi:hypothetical protein